MLELQQEAPAPVPVDVSDVALHHHAGARIAVACVIGGFEEWVGDWLGILKRSKSVYNLSWRLARTCDYPALIQGHDLCVVVAIV